MRIAYDYDPVPTIRQFALSDARIRGLLGPWGSGKSTGCVTELVRRGQQMPRSPDGIRHSRYAVVRNTFPELRDTTLKTIFQWLPPIHFGHYAEQRHSYQIKAFAGVDIELLMLALDRPEDIGKLLSLEISGAWVNEAREIPWGIVEALDGRIGRYPRMADVGSKAWFGMWMDTNPPDTDSAWYRFFEDGKWMKDFLRLQKDGHFPASMKPEEYAAIFKQPSGLSPQAENLINLQPGYYPKLAVGKSREWVKVYCEGEYGFVVEGKLVYPEYSDQVHCQKVEPMEGLTVIRGWDFGLCYSDDTEVLTDSGWKLFKDVDETVDRAASRDPKTGRFEWAPIAFKVAKPFKGEMLEWASTEVNMCVTPEHIVPFTFRDSPGVLHWKSAEWLAEHMGGHHYVDLVSEWVPEQEPSTIFGMPTSAFSAFAGLFLAEGTADAKGRIAIYQIKEKTRAEMEQILAATGLKWKWFDYAAANGRAAGWRTHHRTLAPWLSATGKQIVRRIPRLVCELSAANLRIFVDAYTLGDGHIRTRPNGSVEHTIFTASAEMAADLQEIAQKIGWNCSVRWRKPQTSIITEGATKRAIVNRGGWEVAFKKVATRAELLRRNFRRVPYDGTVYCLNVPHHTLYVRRNGRPHWNGNTPACVFSQLLPDGRWLVFDEMTSENMSIDQFSDEVLEHCNRAFRGANVRFEDWGDPAGNQQAQTDKRTCFQIMQNKNIMVEGSIQDPTHRQEAVRKTLRTLVGGEPQFILHPRCRVLRKGFLGAYHRRRLSVSGAERYAAEPEKNFASHPHDANQYSMVKYFGPALVGDAPVDDDWPDGYSVSVEDRRPRSSTGY